MSQPDRNINENDQRLKRSQHRQSPSATRSPLTGERSAPARIIAEQEPAYRSVAIGPPSQQQRTLRFEPALRRAAPVGISHLRPLLGAAQPQLVGKAPPKAGDQPSVGGRSKNDPGIPGIWHVEHAGLPGRADDLPLSRTSRVVFARADAISERISDCLRSRSIETKFSGSDDGDNVARCRNTDFCEFNIGLYAAENDGVLVEVRRLRGDCISFTKDCRAILNASEGNTESIPSEEKPLHLRLPVSEMKFLKTASLPPVSPDEEGDCVRVTTELLSSHQSNQNMLGMENLAVQTDPLRTLKSTAVTVSRMILCPDDPGNKPFSVHDCVMSLLVYGEDEAPGDPALASLEDRSSKLRNLALSALSNALALHAAEGLLPAAVAPHREWYADVLVPGLLRDLGASARRPFDACYASRCLSALAESSTELAAAMKDAGGHEAATSAREVGAREFAMLARDAGSYHNVLMSCCV